VALHFVLASDLPSPFDQHVIDTLVWTFGVVERGALVELPRGQCVAEEDSPTDFRPGWRAFTARADFLQDVACQISATLLLGLRALARAELCTNAGRSWGADRGAGGAASLPADGDLVGLARGGVVVVVVGPTVGGDTRVAEQPLGPGPA
jgi:hypothetical protein